MLVEFVLVFFAFDAEEDAAEEHGDDEAANQQRPAGGLRGPNGKYDGQAAANEHGGVGGAKGCVDGFAGGAEVAEVPETIDQISAEHAAEEHDFGREENPHAQAGGIALLTLGGKVMPQREAIRRMFAAVNAAVCDNRLAIGQRGPPGDGQRRRAERPARRSCRLPR